MADSEDENNSTASGVGSNGGESKLDSFESIKVLVRVRPLSEAEKSENNDSVVDIIGDQSLRVTSVDGKKSYKCSFDAVLGPTASQSDVYRTVRSCTESVLEGFNSTIFAYGQTGSGKTHSMYGPPNYNSTASLHAAPRDTQLIGLIPRAVNEIFELSKTKSVQDFEVHCSFVQIYNENLYDMLRDSSMNTPLAIREDQREMYVQGLSEYSVKSVSDTLQLLRIAEENRAIRETHMNMFSSRSHSIFQIQVEYKKVDDSDPLDASESIDGIPLQGSSGGEATYRAKFNLVDLAGSEKWNTKQYLRDEHIAEMTNINLSLHTLGKCISSLAQASRQTNKLRKNYINNSLNSSSLDQGSLTSGASIEAAGVSDKGLGSRAASSSGINRLSHSNSNLISNSSSNNLVDGAMGGNNLVAGVHVPFRESKLTRLLQDSLGGNAKTFLIATVSPARCNCDETISTLKFADRAKQVMVQAVINESRPVDHALVQRLQQEIGMLKSLVKRLAQQQQSPQQQLQLGSPSKSSGGGGGGRGIGIANIDQNGKPFPSPGRINSATNTSTTGTATGTVEAGMSAAARDAALGEGGGGKVGYITSLEKALNKEQIHSQHLQKKNETLIKELEALKFENMRLFGNAAAAAATGADVGSGYDAGSEAAAKFFSDRPHYNLTQQQPSGSNSGGSGLHVDVDAGDLSLGELRISKAQAAQVVDSVQALSMEHTELWSKTDAMQKTLKKFFKFQIEEEEMKQQLMKMFEELKTLRSSGASSRVADNFAFLQFIATTAAKTPKQQHHKQFPNSKSPVNSMRMPSNSKLSSVITPTRSDSLNVMSNGASDYLSLNAANLKSSTGRNLPSMQHQQQGFEAGTEEADVFYGGSMGGHNPNSSSTAKKKDSNGERSKNSKHKKKTSTSSNTAAADPSDFTTFSPQRQSQDMNISQANRGEDLHVQEVLSSRASSSNSMRGGAVPVGAVAPAEFQNLSSGYNLNEYQQAPVAAGMGVSALQQVHGHQTHHQSLSPVKQVDLNNQQLHPPHQVSAAPQMMINLPYRVRQGPSSSNPHQQQSQDPLESSVNSSGGWIQPLATEATEELLRKELKKAKKKLKKQQKMEEWQREKDAKAESEAKAKEEERLAVLREEKERERRRRAHVEKQKQKLTEYQNKVKFEAEKIQDLKKLGIDPTSLGYA